MPVVWKISVINLPKRTLINGVLLNSTPFSFDKKTTKFRHALYVIKSYFIGVYGNKEILITVNQETITTTTDKHGGFSVVTGFPVNSEVLVKAAGNDEALKILQDYPIVFQNTNSRIDVISDIDDTILISHTANIIKRIGVLSFVTPAKRKTIQFTQKLLHLFNENPTNVFYVSKSESNLFGILSEFIKHHQLPKGVLFLTPYLNFQQLVKGKKGKDFKLNTIRFIIENSEDKEFILFGDDTQRDMEVYEIIAKTYPEKIARIYIRQTSKNVNKRKKVLLKNLKESFPNSVYFNKNTDIDFELKQLEDLILPKNDIK